MAGVARELQTKTGIVNIVGGCSPEGSSEWNLALGFSRAQAVKEYLTAYGIDANRINVSSVGEELLVSTVESEYWKDRRAEISIK
jgi:peptidoglycan-associated lipoprotein